MYWEVEAFIPFTDAAGNKYALWIEDKSSHTSLNDIGRKLYQQFNGLYKEKGGMAVINLDGAVFRTDQLVPGRDVVAVLPGCLPGMTGAERLVAQRKILDAVRADVAKGKVGLQARLDQKLGVDLATRLERSIEWGMVVPGLGVIPHEAIETLTDEEYAQAHVVALDRIIQRI